MDAPFLHPVDLVSKIVADRLIRDFKSGAISKIDINVIRTAIRRELDEPDDFEIGAALEWETTLRVVEGV